MRILRSCVITLLLLTLVSMAFFLLRSGQRSHVLALRTPGGCLQLLVSHRGGIVLFASDMPYESEHGGWFDTLSVAAGELDRSEEFVFDPVNGGHARAGFKYGSGPVPFATSTPIPTYHCVRVPDWAVIASAGVLFMMVLRGPLRARRWRKQGRCPKCGYDLRESRDRCPECGHAVGSTMADATRRGGRIGGLVLACAAILAASISLNSVVTAHARGSRTPPVDRPIVDRMEPTIPEVEFDNVELRDVADFLSDVLGIPFRLDEPALASVGVSRHTPVTTKIRNIKASTAIRIILDTLPGRVDAVPDGSGGFVFTTRRANTKLRVYEFGYLIRDIDLYADLESPGTLSNVDARTRDELLEEIVTLVSETVDPDSWINHGGSVGNIRTVGGRLIVVQTPENHEKVRSLLEKMHEILFITFQEFIRDLAESEPQ